MFDFRAKPASGGSDGASCFLGFSPSFSVIESFSLGRATVEAPLSARLREQAMGDADTFCVRASATRKVSVLSRWRSMPSWEPRFAWRLDSPPRVRLRGVAVLCNPALVLGMCLFNLAARHQPGCCWRNRRDALLQRPSCVWSRCLSLW